MSKITNCINFSTSELSEISLLVYKSFPERHYRLLTIKSWRNVMKTEDEGGNWKYDDNKIRKNENNLLDEGNQD